MLITLKIKMWMLSYTAVHNKNKLVYESYTAAHIDNNLHTVVKHGAKVYRFILTLSGTEARIWRFSFAQKAMNSLAWVKSPLTGNSGEHWAVLPANVTRIDPLMCFQSNSSLEQPHVTKPRQSLAWLKNYSIEWRPLSRSGSDDWPVCV